MSLSHSIRREVGGALRSLRYDLFDNEKGSARRPKRRGGTLAGLTVLVLAVAGGSYFAVLGVAEAVRGDSSAAAEAPAPPNADAEAAFSGAGSPVHRLPTIAPTHGAQAKPAAPMPSASRAAQPVADKAPVTAASPEKTPTVSPSASVSASPSPTPSSTPSVSPSSGSAG